MTFTQNIDRWVDKFLPKMEKEIEKGNYKKLKIDEYSITIKVLNEEFDIWIYINQPISLYKMYSNQPVFDRVQYYIVDKRLINQNLREILLSKTQSEYDAEKDAIQQEIDILKEKIRSYK